MNVGQVLETHLDWAATLLGFHVETPVFDGPREDEIREVLKKAAKTEEGVQVAICETGKTRLYDGRSGERFAQPVTAGQIYMMKLLHPSVRSSQKARRAAEHQASECDPRMARLDARHYLKRGLLYADLRNFQTALADFSKALEVHPGDAGAYLARGNLYNSQADYPAAPW